MLPPNHPDVKPQKIGVLLINLGTPEATDYWTMRKYLSEFLSDKRVIDYPSIFWQPLLQGIILSVRPKKSGHAYEQIWNTRDDESPLRTYTRIQCEELAGRFQKKHPEIIFDWAMRYGTPPIAKGIDNLRDQGCQKIILFALYPQYSASTTASVYDKAFDHLKKIVWQPAIRSVPSFHDDPDYIDALAKIAQETLEALPKKPEVMVTSFHGLPTRYLTKKGDPYHCQCQKTSRLVQEALGWPKDKWITTFQSRFGPEKWLQPYTDKTIEQLARDGVKHIGIMSPAFVSECVETLEEICIGVKESFIEHGGEEFTYIPCLNDSKIGIDLFEKIVSRELQGWT